MRLADPAVPPGGSVYSDRHQDAQLHKRAVASLHSLRAPAWGEGGGHFRAGASVIWMSGNGRPLPSSSDRPVS